MLKQLGLKKLAQAINKILASDPLSLEEVQQLQAQVLRIELLKTPFIILVEFHPYGIELKQANADSKATVSLTGKPSALLRFAKTNSQTQMLMDKEVKINGDLELLMQIKKIQQRLAIDWEGLLAEYVGDFVANRFMMLAKRAKAKISSQLQSLRADSLDYLHYEIQLLPTREEVNQFHDDLRDLRRDIERLEVKIKKQERV